MKQTITLDIDFTGNIEDQIAEAQQKVKNVIMNTVDDIRRINKRLNNLDQKEKEILKDFNPTRQYGKIRLTEIAQEQAKLEEELKKYGVL